MKRFEALEDQTHPIAISKRNRAFRELKTALIPYPGGDPPAGKIF
jgi:hypothetical protein